MMERETAATDGYADQFRRLRVNMNPRARPSPHKPCLLLAVIELVAHGALQDNRIEYSAQLRSTYERYRRAVDDPGRESGPWYPFFHLRNEPFWHLHARIGRESALAEMKRATSERAVETNVSHASLDPLLYSLLLDQEASNRLRDSPDRPLVLHRQGGRHLCRRGPGWRAPRLAGNAVTKRVSAWR